MTNEDEDRSRERDGSTKKNKNRQHFEPLTPMQILRNPNRQPPSETIDMSKIRNEQQKSANNGKNKTPNNRNGRNQNNSMPSSSNGTRFRAPNWLEEPRSLMEIDLEADAANKQYRNDSYPATTISPPTQISERQRAANLVQRTQYYKSENPGQIPTKIMDPCPRYTKEDFPMEKNVTILIDKKFDLMITPCSARCHAIFIRVKSQHTDDTFSVASILSSNASPQKIRKACVECMELFADSTYRKNERSRFNENSEEYLKKCSIKQLTEPAEAFPDALYYCTRCDFHVNSVTHAKAHLEQSAHFDDVEREQQREKLLADTPIPSESHYDAATVYLETLVDDQIEKRLIDDIIVEEVLVFIRVKLFEQMNYDGVHLQVFGSTTYNVFLEDSDVNVAFSIDSVDNSQLLGFYAKLVENLNKMNSNFAATMVSDGSNSTAITFIYKLITVRLCSAMNTSCRAQLSFSQLMKTYVDFKPEIARFMLLVREWAVTVGIDSKNRQRVGLPRYGFDIMSIHYLQHVGLLPILHELGLQKTENDSHRESDVVEEAKEKRIRIMSNYCHDVKEIRKLFKSEKEWKLGKVWIGFLRYLLEKHRDIVIQITQNEPMTKEMTRWNRKSYHIVDPFRAENVLPMPKVLPWLSFFFNCILVSFKTFAIPRTESGPVVNVEFYQNKVPSPKKNKKKGSQTESPVKPLNITPKRAFTYNAPKDDTPKVANVYFVEPIQEEVDEPKVEKDENEAYNSAADEVAYDNEVAEKSKQLCARLRFDGVPLTRLTSEHTEIDEPSKFMRSRRTVLRIRRVGGRCQEAQIHASIPTGIVRKKGKKSKKAAKSVEEKKEVVVENEAVLETQSTSAAAEVESAVNQRSITPPVENSWAHWSRDPLPSADWGPVFSISDVTTNENGHSKAVEAETTANKKPAEKDEVTKIADDLTSLQIDQKPTTSTSNRKIEFGQFVAQSSSSLTFNNHHANVEVRTTDELICYEEFFIRHNVMNAPAGKRLEVDDYHFSFDPQTLTAGYEMEIKCSSCDGNHIVDNCPSMKIPAVEEFAKRTKSEIQELDMVIDKYYEDNAINQERLNVLEKQVKILETFLRAQYRNDVVLTIFGSVMTGIGVKRSDIDVCLRFGDGYEQPEDHIAEKSKNIKPVDVITKVSELLRKSKITKRVQAILTAKVPIVKFQIRIDRDVYVDADISYYNILALYNTKLLKTYTLWSADNKFAKLGLFIKHWAKNCDIGDASKGSISSYAHIILLLSYLQECDPQVLPRLQEDFRTPSSEKRIVDSWDTYFHDGEPKPYHGNHQSCAELLLGFFDYYSRFDFRQFVIQCRRDHNLSKLEKQWNKPLCIEDPFDLHHNLGAGVTRRMFAFIHRTFICSREVFMTTDIRDTITKDSNFLDNYRKELMRKCSQGHAPSDRQCHTCSKIGHFAESCPKRLAQREAKRHRVSSQSTVGSYQGGRERNFNGEASGSTPKRGFNEEQHQKKPFYRR